MRRVTQQKVTDSTGDSAGYPKTGCDLLLFISPYTCCQCRFPTDDTSIPCMIYKYSMLLYTHRCQ